MTPAAARQRRYRDRIREGRISVTHDVDVSIVEALIAVGLLDRRDVDDAEAIGRALERAEVVIVGPA
jgi:hypothetical protein